MTGLRTALLALLGGIAVAGFTLAPAFAGAEPAVEMRSRADDGDPFAQWQLGGFYRQRNHPGDDTQAPEAQKPQFAARSDDFWNRH